MSSRLSVLIFVTWILLLESSIGPSEGQIYRGLLHWKRDLEYRLGSYANQQNVIANILDSSIYAAPETINGPIRVSSVVSNVRFSDLIIPTGSLILDSQIAQPSIQSQLESIKLKLSDPSQNFIYKGLPNRGPMPMNITTIPGNRLFKQFTFGNIIQSKSVTLGQINYTNVDQVLTDTYMENAKFGVRDSKSRLFFEGRKTFWRTVFARPLQSGCCDRLKPLHTSRMMTRSHNQDISAPVMFQASDPYSRDQIFIRSLITPQIHNRKLIINQMSNRPGDIGLVSSPGENFIQPYDLINIRQPLANRTDLPKTLVFKNTLMVEQASLAHSYPGNRLMIGTGANGTRFDVSHENYLLKFPASSNRLQPQRVEGSLVINGESIFVNGINSMSVNGVQNFTSFALNNIVRIDRPTVIQGHVQFDAMPYVFNTPPAGPSQGFLIMSVHGGLNVSLVNGMRLPQDLVLLHQPPLYNYTLPDTIYIRGSRVFSAPTFFEAPVEVRQLVNNIQMPVGVIPLHGDDNPADYLVKSNIWFVDGLHAGDIIVRSGYFGDLEVNNVYSDAHSLIVNSILVAQPDGSHIIKAPLRVVNLQLKGEGPNQGLLNGFRPDSILELSTRPQDHLHIINGRKTFLAPVEVADCVFSDINQLANWTSHLIRIDRPHTVQTIHSKLLFTNPYQNDANQLSSVDIVRFLVNFYPNHNQLHYMSNLNLSPEFYIIHRALARGIANHTDVRVRASQIVLYNPLARINGITLNDVVTLDAPFRFADRFVMVGKVDVLGNLQASRITSNYPLDVMDLGQFYQYRVPIGGSFEPIRLNNLVLSVNNRASFVQCRFINGISFNEFANSIMSLTRPQVVESKMTFLAPVNLEGLARTAGGPLNGIGNFRGFANSLKNAKYVFEDGLQCNSVIVKT